MSYPCQGRFILSLTKTLIFTLLANALLVLPTFAADRSLDTVAGRIVVSIANDKCSLSLNGQLLLNLDCVASFLPVFLGKFGKTGPFDQVVVLQESPKGNACNGGPLYLIGMGRNKSSAVFGPVDFCGGRSPVFSKGADSITIIFPGGTPNIGTGHIPDEKWLFHDKKVTKIQ